MGKKRELNIPFPEDVEKIISKVLDFRLDVDMNINTLIEILEIVFPTEKIDKERIEEITNNCIIQKYKNL